MNGRRGVIWWDGKERLLHAFGWAGEAWAVSAYGSIIVGQFHPMDSYNKLGHGASTYMYTNWDGHFTDLGAVAVPIGGDQHNYLSQPFAVSDDGTVTGGETGRSEKFAMIWTKETGMVYVSDYLTNHGVIGHLKWVKFIKTNYVSPDGHVVVGYGMDTRNSVKSFIITIP
jgi:uncharacterized membrane protein